MRKKTVMLVLLLVITTVGGASSGRKYFCYATGFTKKAVHSLTKPSKDSLALVQLQRDYGLLRDSLEKQRKIMSKRYLASSSPQVKAAILKEAGNALRIALGDKLYPSWYGTEWDFNGITESPGQGKIACGYFVSTTLKHAGLKLNRYKLAQQYSHSIVKSVCTALVTFYEFEKMLAYLHQQPDDLYVVGLDNHVGIIRKKGEAVYFIHSSYVFPSYVLSEQAQSSALLGSSSLYVLGNMTSNPALLKAWLMGTEVKIVP